MILQASKNLSEILATALSELGQSPEEPPPKYLQYVLNSAFYRHKNWRPHGRVEFPHARVGLQITIYLEL